MRNVLQVGPIPLVANTRIVSAPFGTCCAKADSMLPLPISSQQPVKVYILAGRAVETDRGVLPSLSKEQSEQAQHPQVVCADTFGSSQLPLTLYLADPGTGTGTCRYRLAPPPDGVGKFSPSTNTEFYAAAILRQSAPKNPVRCEMACQPLCTKY
jgi:hypothetical protein